MDIGFKPHRGHCGYSIMVSKQKRRKIKDEAKALLQGIAVAFFSEKMI